MAVYALIQASAVANTVEADAAFASAVGPQWQRVELLSPAALAAGVGIGWTWTGVGSVPFAPPPAPTTTPPTPAPFVPQSVSAFQGAMALHQSGLLSTVQAYMDSQAASIEAKLAWQRAGDWERNSPTVLAMLQLLGLSAAQGDQLFIAAKGIKA
ncbi:MAG: hypothetical protein HEQ39_10045 [Rhizobacter sp.]